MHFLLTVIYAVLTIGYGANIPSGLIPQALTRIVGGQDASIELVPWQVSLVLFGSHHCGGSIISRDVILTAAHCTIDMPERYLKVRAGTQYRSAGGKLIGVKSYEIHPNFSLRTMDYDVSIVFLKNKFHYEPNIRPIGLARELITDNSTAIVSGWGKLSERGRPAQILQYTTINIINQSLCNVLYKNGITERMLCAAAEGKDACQQDSGGPLVADARLIGIVSWGEGCARKDLPGVYTNVFNLRKWINSIVYGYNKK